MCWLYSRCATVSIERSVFGVKVASLVVCSVMRYCASEALLRATNRPVNKTKLADVVLVYHR